MMLLDLLKTKVENFILMLLIILMIHVQELHFIQIRMKLVILL